MFFRAPGHRLGLFRALGTRSARNEARKKPRRSGAGEGGGQWCASKVSPEYFLRALYQGSAIKKRLQVFEGHPVLLATTIFHKGVKEVPLVVRGLGEQGHGGLELHIVGLAEYIA